MTKIMEINVRIETGDRQGADTKGEVYLGIGGRVFLLDTTAPGDFQRGKQQEFTLAKGGAGNTYPHYSDPTEPFPITTEAADSFPVWVLFIAAGEQQGPDCVRKEHDTWNVERVQVVANPGSDDRIYEALKGPAHQWLGVDRGQSWFLLTET